MFANWLKARVAPHLVGIARAWIRYVPCTLTKHWVWDRFSWRYRPFICRTRFGAIMKGNTEDLIQRHLYYFGVWEPHLTRVVSSMLKSGDVFIDVGANVGYYTLLAAPIVGELGGVVAIEASPSIFRLTLEHISLNGIRNVRAINAAATELRGRVQLYPGRSANIGGTSIVYQVSDAEPIDVEGIPLAEILTDEEVARTKLIKIDVEGAELLVLLGLAAVLPRLRRDAAILMEVSAVHLSEGDAAVRRIFTLMCENNFQAYEIRNEYSAAAYIADEAPLVPRPISEPLLGYVGDVLFVKQ